MKFATTLPTSPYACCYTTLGNEKFKKNEFVVASNFVIHPQILIFSVFKTASLSPY